MRTGLLVLLASLVALAGLPHAAVAATAVVVAGEEVVAAGGPERSAMTIAEGPAFPDGTPEYRLSDDLGAVVAGEGCRQDGDRSVVCALPGGAAPRQIRADLGGGDDLFRQQTDSDVAVDLRGGEGNDYLIGGAGADRLDGGPGDDFLAGDESLTTPGAGRFRPDEMRGGPGSDWVVYGDHGADRLAVSIDSVADDGAPGEGDLVWPDVENIQGDATAENDLRGDFRPNGIVGGDRNDRIHGDAGHDYVSAGAGDDTIIERDAATDTIACRAGDDYAAVDSFDDVDFDCERLDPPRRPPREPAPAPVVVPVVPFPVTLDAADVRVSPGRHVFLTVACGGAGQAPDCVGRLAASSAKRIRMGRRRRTLRVGTRAFRIPAGQTATIALRLSEGETKALRRAKRVALVVRAVESAAQPHVVAARVLLRRRGA
ncbi:MAG TPA: calcium-binding protein [Solirubrobacteraceae bacterium]